MSAEKVEEKQETATVAPIVAKNGGKKKRTGLIVIIVFAAVLLLGGGSALAAVLINNARNGGTNHNCPTGYYWGYGGNPTNMTKAEIEAASSCLNMMEELKPIIYLYPTQTEKVSVKLSNPQNFTAQYPIYGDGWNVIAQPNGDLTDTKTGCTLYALYYESKNETPATVRRDGFVVRGDQTADFLTDILPRLGLNARESEEFIIYWLPILQNHPWNYIRFETAAEIAANQQLTVSPQPDTVIRVMMSYQPLSRPMAVEPQKIVTPNRTGFVVVEWGGTEIGGGTAK